MDASGAATEDSDSVDEKSEAELHVRLVGLDLKKDNSR